MFDDCGFVIDIEFLKELDKLKEPLLVLLEKQKAKLSPKDYRLLALVMGDMVSLAFTMVSVCACTKAKLEVSNV